MPRTLTIHDLAPDTAKRLVVYAEAQTMSLNQAVKELLASALGVRPAKVRRHDNGLKSFRGIMSAESADQLLDHVANADFSHVEEEDC